MTTRTKSSCDYPSQLAQDKSLGWEPATLFGSFENKPLVTSSITSASSAGTSTNTSFSARSLATSFDSSTDGNDAAKHGCWDKSPRPPLIKSLVPRSDSDLANRYESEANEVSTGKIRAPPDPMDIDSKSTIPSKNAFQAESLDLQVRTDPTISSTLLGENLAERLRKNSPFGNLSSFLRFCLCLLILVRIISSPRSLSVRAVSTSL